MELDTRAGGVALIAGYLVLIAALFRNPAEGVDAATATPGGFVFFVGLPVLGIASGLYTSLEYTLATLLAFIASSYLGILGIGLMLLPATNAVVTTALGLLLLGLAVLAMVATLRSSIESLFP